MRLFRHGDPGRERPGVELGDGTRVDAAGFAEDFGEAFFGGDGLERLAQWLREHGADAPRVDRGRRIGPPIARPSKIVCAGRNYAAHAKEMGAEAPAEPVLFLKATSALCGPEDDLVRPPGAEKLDCEVELAVVIGRRAKNVAPERALEHVAGFALIDDVSDRGFQLERGGQWTKGKSSDTFAPLGPVLVTLDELPGFRSLDLWSRVNGEERQRGNTSKLIFDVPALVAYASRFMTLYPGDVISTGTPAGVGMGRVPPLFLRDGDVVECGIEGLGSSRQRVVESQAG